MASGPAERARLLRLTRDHVLEHGLVGLSLREVARSIGSNNRMLLYHFGSLDELLGAAIEEILDRGRLVATLSELMSAEATTEARLAAAWAHISHPDRRPHLRIFFARFGMASEHPDRYRAFLERTAREWTDAVARALADDDRIEDPDATARGIVSLWRGLQILLIAGDPPDVLDTAHAAAVDAILGRGTERP